MPNKGDVIKIYQKPITFDDFEGDAWLISEYRPDDGDGLSMWEVEFVDEPGNIHLRTIYQPAQRIQIEWVLPGWYKSIETDDGIKLTRVAPGDSTRIDAQKLAGKGATVNFYQEPPEYMEVVESDILDLIDYGEV